LNLFIPYWLAAGAAYLVLALVFGWAFVALVNLSWYAICEATRKAKLWYPFLLFIADKLGREKWQDIAEVVAKLHEARDQAHAKQMKLYDYRQALERVVYRLPEEVPFDSDEDRAAFLEGLAEADALLKKGLL
jgi:hypothetical protein